VNQISKQGGSGFSLSPQNLDEAMRMADMLSKSGMVPNQYQNRPQDTLVAMMMGSEIGLNPIQSLQNIAVINGKPSIYADALLALVQNHPKFGGHEEEFDDSSMTATCTVWRKGDDKKHTVTFSKADAELAMLWNKPGPWKQYPKRMLMWRARGYALRDKFADALGGLITAEEAQDIPVQDMGTAQRVDRPQESSSPALEHYPADQFEANFPAWKDAIAAGKRTADQIIAMVSSKAELTEEQKTQIKNVEEGEAA